MMIEGKNISRDLLEETDVCVIGSGAGGAITACELAEAGHRVILVEEGGYYPSETFDQHQDDMFARIQGGRGWDASRDMSISLTYSKCVGGTTVHYWADSFRIPEDRLEMWQRKFGVKFSSESLRPVYEKVEKAINVEPAAEYMFNENNKKIRKGVEALGWKGEVVTQARKECMACGFCYEGCHYLRKQSMLVTYIPRAEQFGARIFSDARVDHLLVENGKAVGVVAQVLDRATKRARHTVRIRAKVVVLAAGGLGSPQILLKSRIANSSGQVGKNFYINPGAMAWALFDEDINAYTAIPSAYAVKQFRRVVMDQKGNYVEGGYLILPNGLHPGVFAALMPGFGATHRKFMDNLNRYGGTFSILDDEDSGRISLDRQGRPVFDYTVSERDKKKIRDFLKKSSLILLAAGAREVLIPDSAKTIIRDPSEFWKIDRMDFSPGSTIFAGPHPMGTCRMGANPETSVVNPYGESHEVQNLFIADASIFPTSVSVDPSLTIMAFATEIAHYISRRLG